MIIARSASTADIPFLARAVRAADGGSHPAGLSALELVFKLSGAELEEVLSAALALETTANPLALSSFVVLEEDGVSIGSCAAWDEEEDCPSGFAVADALARSLGIGRWRAGAEGMRLLARARSARTPATLQLEYFHVIPQRRGAGLTTTLVRAAEARSRASCGEIALVSTNVRARRAYERAGYALEMVGPQDPDLLPLLGGPGLMTMTRRFGGQERLDERHRTTA